MRHPFLIYFFKNIPPPDQACQTEVYQFICPKTKEANIFVLKYRKILGL